MTSDEQSTANFHQYPCLKDGFKNGYDLLKLAVPLALKLV